MKCFFTSDPILDNTVNPSNGLLLELKKSLPSSCHVLYISSDPADFARTDRHADGMKACLGTSGFQISHFSVLDNRTRQDTEKLVRDADFIILAGGHVPTQNTFFQEIGLKEILKDFRGILLGISAGTMNSAEIVYVHPEREGEAIDETFQRFREGLGLTKHMVLPHYQLIKDDVLDGLRVFEDIAYPDSMGKKFYALVDGSYILSCDGNEKLYGEAYLIKDGTIQQISSEGDALSL